MKKQKATSKKGESVSKIFKPSSEEHPMNMYSLPYEVQINIVNILEPKDLVSLGLSTQQNYQIVNEYLKKMYTTRAVELPQNKPVQDEKIKNYGITYFQIHYSEYEIKCVHCWCNSKKRKLFYIPTIQAYVCSKCMKEKEQYTCIVKTQAKKQWYLEDDDLKDLVSFQKKAMGYSMSLYLLVEIEEKAHEKYGGQQKFEEYKEQRVSKYIQRRNKVEENRDLKNERELIVQRYYNQYCYKYVKSEDILQIQRIKKYIKTNVPKNEQKRVKLFEQVKEKLDKIESYQNTQINKQYKMISPCDLNEESQRKDLVIKLLDIYGLSLRSDSRLCGMFIENHPKLHKNIYEIIEIMRRKHYLHRQTRYPEYQMEDYYSWRSFLTEQQCEQKAIKQWVTNNQQDTSQFPYTIQLEFLQYRDD